MLLFCWSWSWWYSTIDISSLGQCRLNHIFIWFHEKPMSQFKLNNFSLPTNSLRSLHVIIENVCLEIVGSHRTAPRRQIWSLRIKRHSLSYNQWTSIMFYCNKTMVGRGCLSGRLSNKWQFLLLKGDRKNSNLAATKNLFNWKDQRFKWSLIFNYDNCKLCCCCTRG